MKVGLGAGLTPPHTGANTPTYGRLRKGNSDRLANQRSPSGGGRCVRACASLKKGAKKRTENDVFWTPNAFFTSLDTGIYVTPPLPPLPNSLFPLPFPRPPQQQQQPRLPELAPRQ